MNEPRRHTDCLAFPWPGSFARGEGIMATDTMNRVNESQADDPGLESPKKGDRFRCRSCGMEIEVTTGCGCDASNHVHFHCCNREMAKV